MPGMINESKRISEVLPEIWWIFPADRRTGLSDCSGIFIENNVKISDDGKNTVRRKHVCSVKRTKGEKRMIMVIGGRCQGKSSFAREHFENRIQENKKLEKEGNQKDHLENLKTDPGQMENIHLGRIFTSTWSRNFHLLVRRILKKDETLGLRMSRKQLYLKQHLQVSGLEKNGRNHL